MAHSQLEEAAPVDDMDSAAAAIDALGLDGPVDDDSEGQDEQDHEEGEGDLELDDDNEEGEQDDEPETAIDAPASLTAEEKAKFAALPKEAQEYVASLEARRATQVQTATTKAAEAQRTAEAAAARADATAKATYAQQLKVFADSFAPQRPDPQLIHTNPQEYMYLNAQYEAGKAQHDELMQHVDSLGQEAETALTETEQAERDRALMAIPEVANEATREQFFSKAIEEGKRLGLDMSKVGSATAEEFKALREIASLREKAEKYDAAMARQMQRVRGGKNKARTARPNAAQPSSGEKAGYRESRDRLRQTGSVDDAAAAISRLGL